MGKQLPVILAFLWAFSLSAQENRPIVLVSVQGKIKYTSAETKKAAKVRAGAVLKPSGTVTLPKKSQALLYSDGRYVLLSTPGKHPLDKRIATGTQSLGFEYDFGVFIQAAVELTAFANQQEYAWVKSITNPAIGGDGWSTGMPESKIGSSGWGTGMPQSKTGSSGWGTGMPQSKTGSSGWGNGMPGSKTGSSGWGSSGSSITAILPKGKITPSSTTFFWSNPGQSNSFHFEILDESNTAVYQAEPRDSFLTLDVATLNLTAGAKYHWRVIETSNAATVSGLLDFEVGSEDKLKAALTRANSMPILAITNDISLRRVAEAASLEKSDWYYAAYQTYAQVSKTNPTNLTRMMYAAFWRRLDCIPLMEQAASGI